MDTKKYETVVAYICRIATKGDKRLNKTKLVKTVWLADLLNFEDHGVTITDDNMIRMKNGPVNEKILRVIDDAVENKSIERYPVIGGEYGETLYGSHANPRIDDYLTPHEVANINEAANRTLDKTARELSDFSHRFEAWKNHKNGDIITPIEFFMHDAELDESDYTFIEQNPHLFNTDAPELETA